MTKLRRSLHENSQPRMRNGKRSDFALRRHARAIHGKSTSFQAVGVISIALRRTGFGNISVSHPALCFPGLIIKARKLVATSDDAAKSPSIRLKGFEFREEEF